jgi:hypothetical protein
VVALVLFRARRGKKQDRRPTTALFVSFIVCFILGFVFVIAPIAGFSYLRHENNNGYVPAPIKLYYNDEATYDDYDDDEYSDEDGYDDEELEDEELFEAYSFDFQGKRYYSVTDALYEKNNPGEYSPDSVEIRYGVDYETGIFNKVNLRKPIANLDESIENTISAKILAVFLGHPGISNVYEAPGHPEREILFAGAAYDHPDFDLYCDGELLDEKVMYYNDEVNYSKQLIKTEDKKVYGLKSYDYTGMPIALDVDKQAEADIEKAYSDVWVYDANVSDLGAATDYGMIARSDIGNTFEFRIVSDDGVMERSVATMCIEGGRVYAYIWVSKDVSYYGDEGTSALAGGGENGSGSSSAYAGDEYVAILSPLPDATNAKLLPLLESIE